MNERISDLYGEPINELRGKKLPDVSLPQGALGNFISSFLRDKVEGVKNYFRGGFNYYKDSVTDFVTNPLAKAGKLAGNYYHGDRYNQVKADVRASIHGDYRGMRKNVVPYGSLKLDGRRVDSRHEGDDFYVPQTNYSGLDLYRTAHEVAESQYMKRRGINRFNRFEEAMYEAMVMRSLRELTSYGDRGAEAAYRAAEGSHYLRLVRGDPEDFTRDTIRLDPELGRTINKLFSDRMAA